MRMFNVSVTAMSPSTSEAAWPKAEQVDVLLLLEGTFPFVAGGVSSWVHQIIRGNPDVRFGALFIGARKEDYGPMRYALPDNLVHLDAVYLWEAGAPARTRPAPTQADAATMAQVNEMHERLRHGLDRPDSLPLFAGLLEQAHPQGQLRREVFLHSEAAWQRIRTSYQRHSTDPSFVDYFWTVRTIHAPLWVLRQAVDRCPPARIYHSVSTGYAGTLALLLKHLRPRPFILSEHGIYVKERKIDLYQAEWLKDNRTHFERDPSQGSYYRELWIRFFEHLGQLTYQSADHIVALYEANRQRQVLDGAPAERTSCIPNGIDVQRFAPLRAQRPVDPPPVLCLIGRVVPIKDIKTFIRSMRTVLTRLPQAEAWIAGPEDEDPDYAQECRDLVQRLGLEGSVKFLGFQKLPELLPRIGLVVLSSISEALPLVVLEGYAAGVPTVSTDVGSCRQLIHGLPGEDEAIGASGRVVRIADPEALGLACLELLTDTHAWQRASEAAVRRVETYYQQDMMFERYRALYQQGFAWQA